VAKGNWRDNLDNTLLSVLQEKGVDAFLKVGVDFLNVNPKGDTKLKSQVAGEVCEVVLIGLSMEFARLSGYKMRTYHSVVLKDLRNPKGDFRTELDFVMVTPYFMLTTECKSYYGEVVIRDKCVLEHAGYSMDVWKQSKLHHTHLMQYGQQLVKPGLALPRPPIFANAFVFSNSRLSDERSIEGKKMLKVLTTSSVVQYYEAMFAKYRTPVFDFDRACSVISKCASSVKLHAEHKRFLGY